MKIETVIASARNGRLRICLLVISAMGALIAGNSVLADWELDNNQSHLYYITTKASAVSEVNTFTRLSGGIKSGGQATLMIDLTSIDTAVDIRNQRMQDIVFKTQQFPSAVVTIDVSNTVLTSLSPGESMALEAEARLNLAGAVQEITTELRIMATSSGGLVVENIRPVLLDVNTLSLGDEIEQLRELAGLPSITPVIAVDFSLAYNVVQ